MKLNRCLAQAEQERVRSYTVPLGASLGAALAYDFSVF